MQTNQLRKLASTYIIDFLGKLEFFYGSNVKIKDNQQFENSSRMYSYSHQTYKELFLCGLSKGGKGDDDVFKDQQFEIQIQSPHRIQFAR